MRRILEIVTIIGVAGCLTVAALGFPIEVLVLPGLVAGFGAMALFATRGEDK